MVSESYWDESKGYLFVITDGMESRKHDCHVAKLGADTVYTQYYADTSVNRIMALQKAFEYSNHKVCEECPEAGATCTAVLCHGETLYIAHLGTDRVYRFRDHHLAQITHDHTLAAEWVRKGIVTEDDLQTHPHSLYIPARYFGNPSPLELDILTENLEPKDTVLLCTDGVNYLLDEQITQVLVSHSAENAAQTLMDLVKEVSPPYSPFDDATAIVISCE